ncbi:PREDICTED: uncharacterized protein LOC109168726 [Ipomoea nil]|uniref:uncharacterized protein LOC109168726 n=1 Tax=Ipomoea nil TaxID=35883 RepID=UPI000901F8B5|nr:PREDICTED: uncharacterized protein LOC109168726 [Ipomoea nil]
MRNALEVKNKWDIVNGSFTKPARSHTQYTAWRRCNLMICSWICKLVHPSIVQSILYMDKAKEVWNDLRKRSEREVDQIIRFLQGFNDEFNSLKSNVLVLDPLPDIHRVFVMAEKCERQINIMNLSGLETIHANSVQNTQITSEDTMAAVNYFNSRKNLNNNGSNKAAKCTFCGMSGHTAEKCYKKHDYPPGWVQGFKSRGKQQTQIGQNTPSTTADVSLIPTFNKEVTQGEGRHSINLHVNSVTLDSSVWILDSCATDHIACSLDLFDDYHTVEGALVNLPNGRHIAMEHVGNIKLNDDLWLRNVLHIPIFRFNIVSVTKLLQDSSYTLIFTSDQCLLREKHGKMTGFAKEEKGLYLLLEPPRNYRDSCTHYAMFVALKFGINGWDIFPLIRCSIYIIFMCLVLSI